jgi:ketosteroid isomerase-like protein
MPKSRPVVAWEGRWLMVYQRQPDGSWIIVRDSGEAAQ